MAFEESSRGCFLAMAALHDFPVAIALWQVQERAHARLGGLVVRMDSLVSEVALFSVLTGLGASALGIAFFSVARP